MSKTTVLVQDASGHATLELTKDETLQLLDQNADAWVFARSRRVQPSELAEAEWDDVGTIRVVPGLVGGI